MTHRKVRVYVVFQNIHDEPITEFNVEVKKDGTFSEIRKEISRITSTSPSKLIFCEYLYRTFIFGIIPDFHEIKKIGVDDLIVAHELKDRDKYVKIHAGYNWYFDEVALGIFGYKSRTSVREYDYARHRTNTVVRKEFYPIYDCHFFLPIYHASTSYQTSSKDLYDRCLEKLTQYFTPTELELFVSLYSDILDPLLKSKYFPSSNNELDEENLTNDHVLRIYLLKNLRNYHQLNLETAGEKGEHMMLTYNSEETIVSDHIQEYSQVEEKKIESKKKFGNEDMRTYLTPIEKIVRTIPSVCDRKYPVIFACISPKICELLNLKRENGISLLGKNNFGNENQHRVRSELNYVLQKKCMGRKKVDEDEEERVMFLKEEFFDFFDDEETAYITLGKLQGVYLNLRRERLRFSFLAWMEV